MHSFSYNRQAHTLAALKAWCHWLAMLHTASLKNPLYESQCRELTSRVTLAAVTVVKEGSQEEEEKDGAKSVLVHSAVHFLVTLTGTVRPPSIWKLKEFTDLYAGAQRLSLSPDDHRLLVRSLTNVLLLHWPGLSEQRWEERQKHLAKFLRDVNKDFRNIRATQGFEQNIEMQKLGTDKTLYKKLICGQKFYSVAIFYFFLAHPVIVQTLRIVGDLVENVLDEVTQTKKLCYDCIKEYLEIALWLFRLYVNVPTICGELFDFFHTVFDVLKAQMGATAVESAIQTFLSLFNKDLIVKAIADESVGVRVVERFLGILEFVVKEPSSSFRKFIPSTLQLTLQHIYPLVADVSLLL